MADNPTQVLIKLLPEAEPVLRALRRIGRDVGSVSANRIVDTMPADARFVMVVAVDDGDVAVLGADLRRELADDPDALALTNRCFVLPQELDMRLVVFLDLVALAVASR
jgi:hypothetical protein